MTKFERRAILNRGKRREGYSIQQSRDQQYATQQECAINKRSHPGATPGIDVSKGTKDDAGRGVEDNPAS